jgi:hypothetical protein
VHALAREVAELRDAAASLRADAADARAARDDARRALLEETTRARSLERARVLDLRETRAAEGRALEATKTAWALRDKLALAAVVTTIHRNDGAPNSDVDAERPSSFSRENDVDDDDDDVEVEDLPVEREAKKKDGCEAPASAFFQNAGRARVFVYRFSFRGGRDARDAILGAFDARRRRAVRTERSLAQSRARAAPDGVFADVTTTFSRRQTRFESSTTRAYRVVLRYSRLRRNRSYASAVTG